MILAFIKLCEPWKVWISKNIIVFCAFCHLILLKMYDLIFGTIGTILLTFNLKIDLSKLYSWTQFTLHSMNGVYKPSPEGKYFRIMTKRGFMVGLIIN